MTDVAPHLTAGFWRTRRSAAIAGIIFGVLLLAAMIMLRIALSEGSLQMLQADTQRRTLSGSVSVWCRSPGSPSYGSLVLCASSSARSRIGCFHGLHG